MREIIVILCVAFPVDSDTIQAIPCGVVQVFEGPAATVDADVEPKSIDAIDAEYEVLS